MLNKILYCFALVYFSSPSILYGQSIVKDTVNFNNGIYHVYTLFADSLISSIENPRKHTTLINDYKKQPIGLHNKKGLRENFRWFEKLVREKANPVILLTNYNMPVPGKDTITIVKLSYIYDFGNYHCLSEERSNKIEIIFSDLAKAEKYFEFNFMSCKFSKKIEKEIMSLSPPKN